MITIGYKYFQLLTFISFSLAGFFGMIDFFNTVLKSNNK